MTDKARIVLFDTDQLAMMAKAMALVHERALAEHRIDNSDAEKDRVARILFALAREGTTDLETLVSLTLDALKYGDPRDW